MTEPTRFSKNYADYLRRVEAFLADTICKDEIDDSDYVSGRGRIEFHGDYLRRQRELPIEEHSPKPDEIRVNEFEEALFERLLQPRDFNLLVLLGGLGAGKTTTAKYILRRFAERNDQLRKTFQCPCAGCFREPIYLDFRALGQNRAIRAESIVPEVFRTIRMRTYFQIIAEWLRRIGVDSRNVRGKDPEFLVLRRLLIANDLLRFHGSDHSGLSGLADADLNLALPITDTRLTEGEVSSLIERHRGAALAYEQKLRGVAEDPNHSQDFMVMTLQFYLYRCNPSNPMNLIVIDNLDQLPTRQIEELLSELHDVATRTSGLPLLVPLRPSSINPYGFVREMVFRYHYGPNNFEMILGRLQRYILALSRDDLRASRLENQDRPFQHPPSEVELDILLVVAYLYAKIMAGGLRSIGTPVKAVEIHQDHRFLEQLTIGEGALLSLAETSDALVGACCRYAFDLLKRYFYNCYSNPLLLQRIADAHIEGRVAKALRVPYGELVTFLLRDPIGGAKVSRVANLFRPTRTGTNPAWPSLVKLRLLSLLSRDRRQSVQTLVQRLGSVGIPMELTLEALNSLQDKFRLLLWLSTNRPLKTSDKSSFDEDVVISEHGERYFRRVIGDFEYVWYCATSLHERQYTGATLKFTLKLDDYRRLVSQVGITEWKQICFDRFRAGCLPDISGVGRATPMNVLTILYSSLSRVLLSADIAMRIHGERVRLSSEVRLLLEAICEELLFWQSKYQVAYRSNYYLYVYEDELRELKGSVAEIVTDGFAQGRLRELLSELHASWEAEAKSSGSREIAGIMNVPKENAVTTISRYGRGLIPGIEGMARALDAQRRVAVFFARFLQARAELAATLQTGLPTYSELVRTVSYLLGDIQAVVASAADVAATGENLLRWCIGEKVIIQEVSDILNENRYDVGDSCGCEVMTECKNRNNNIAAATERLARHFAIEETWHFSHRWQ